MSDAPCRLCERNPPIENSHIIPAFVFRALKNDSVTGFMRRPADPNQRFQDGDKHPLLCLDCEAEFSSRERLANDVAFAPFHQTDQSTFEYGPWLHYFLTSVSWRTLVLELSDQSTTERMPEKVLADCHAAEVVMRRNLLGETSLANQIRNHLFLFATGGQFSEKLAKAQPNFMIRRSIGSYALWDGDGHSAIVNNLLGFFFVTIIRGNKKDTWNNTKIDPSGGTFKLGQQATTWIFADFADAILEFSQSNEKLSEKQRGVVAAAVNRNPTAKSNRFREADRQQVRKWI
jgi:hypothetical protein